MKKTIIFLALIATTFFCCSKKSNSQEIDYMTDLIGSWYQERIELGKNKNAMWLFKDVYTLEENGDYKWYYQAKFKDGLHIEIINDSLIKGFGKWSLNGDSMTSYLDYIVKDGDTTYFKEKTNIQTINIMHITPDSLVFQNRKENFYGVMYRVK
jgi:hypothetical protein